MADVEEPQFTTLAQRIAALNKQKNFSSSDTSEPIRKRPPPPPPPGRAAAEARSQTLPIISTTDTSPSPGPGPATGHHGSSAPPPLPKRTPSAQSLGAGASPALPARRPSAQSTNLTVRRNSGSSEVSQHSIISSASLGHTAPSSTTSHGSEASSHKLPPAFDPASLPPLPPTRREREAKESAAQDTVKPKYPLASVKSAPIVRQVEPAPGAKPSLPPRLPTRPVKPQSNGSAEGKPPALPRRQPQPAVAKEAPVKEKRLPILGFGSGNQKPPQLPSERPRIPRRPSHSDDAPPPVPVASRPSQAQIDAASSRSSTPQRTQIDCLTCRDWSGPDTVASKFPRQSLPRNDPVGHLARGLCDPFPSYTDKARAIFTWFHHNILYDTVSFFGKCVKHMTVEDTIFSGKAVCQGYAETYEAIAKRAGLECKVVVGHGKGYGYKPLEKGERPPPPKPDGHAWNAVRVDGGHWRLLDACWGAGHLGADNQYKQEFDPKQFTRSNIQFGLSHFPQESRFQLREDGRIMDWDEYYIGPVDGEPPEFYGNGIQEGIAEDSLGPKERQISVRSNEVVRFQFSKICEHWTSEKHGLGKPPLFLLSIHGVDGRKDEMIPIETDGYWHWVDVNARDLGAPGQSVQVAILTSIQDRDGRGVTYKEFASKKGRVKMSWAYVIRWDLV